MGINSNKNRMVLTHETEKNAHYTKNKENLQY